MPCVRVWCQALSVFASMGGTGASTISCGWLCGLCGCFIKDHPADSLCGVPLCLFVLLLRFLHFPDDIAEAGDHAVIVFLPVRKHAVHAVFDARLRVAEVPAAFAPEDVQRAVAEQAVEALRVRRLVSGKVFTVGILKKRVVPLFHQFFSFSASHSAASGVTTAVWYVV